MCGACGGCGCEWALGILFVGAVRGRLGLKRWDNCQLDGDVISQSIGVAG